MGSLRPFLKFSKQIGSVHDKVGHVRLKLHLKSILFKINYIRDNSLIPSMSYLKCFPFVVFS